MAMHGAVTRDTRLTRGHARHASQQAGMHAGRTMPDALVRR